MGKKPHRNTSTRQNWRTPRWLFRAAQRFVLAGGGDPFTLDAAADKTNTLCATYCDGVKYDGLDLPWANTTWCNPPFAGVKDWVNKAINEAKWNDNASVLLVTASTETKWFETAVKSGHCQGVLFIRGRIGFIHPKSGHPVTGNTSGSALLFFQSDPTPRPVVEWVVRDELKEFGNELDIKVRAS